MRSALFLFGEAQKGTFCQPKTCHNLLDLCNTYGEPPEESKGLHYAIQALMFDRELIFFRVHEEGYSKEEYMLGFRFLKKHKILNLMAICMPGVGDKEILSAATPLCDQYRSLIIIDEKDLYDYLSA